MRITKRRQRFIAPWALALWLFAIFVSVAHACGLDAELGRAPGGEAVTVTSHDGFDDGLSPACEKFCSDDVPVLGKIKTVQDPPAGHVVLTPALADGSFHSASHLPSWWLASPAPPPGIAVNTRFVRLAL